MNYYIEKRGSRELICVVDTLAEAREIVKNTGDIIICQTKARRKEILTVRESAKRKK